MSNTAKNLEITTRSRSWRMALLGVLLCGCGARGADDPQLHVLVDGDRVTIEWDGRPVHHLDVRHLDTNGSSVANWAVRTSLDYPPPEAVDPSIFPPLVFGESPQDAISMEPDPLVRGTTYYVTAEVLGWGASCHEIGIGEDDDPDTKCQLAYGSVEFTY